MFPLPSVREPVVGAPGRADGGDDSVSVDTLLFCETAMGWSTELYDDFHQQNLEVRGVIPGSSSKCQAGSRHCCQGIQAGCSRISLCFGGSRAGRVRLCINQQVGTWEQ